MKRAQFFTSKLYPNFFFNFEKIFFSSSKKKIRKKLIFFWKMKKVKNFNEKSYMIFHWKIDFFIFQKNLQKNRNFFSSSKKIIFFRSWKKKLGYSFDAEIRDLSIYGVFRMIPALLPMFWDSFLSKQLQILVPKPWILMKFAVLATLGPLIWRQPPKCRSTDFREKKFKKFFDQKS